MDPDDRAVHQPRFGVPRDAIPDLELFGHRFLHPAWGLDHSNLLLNAYLCPVKTFDSLLAEVRACRVCADVLPLGPRPIVQASTTARLLIAGQAPGTKVHQSGTPFMDASGERLRQWMNISADEFYDETKVAIVPMGFCYPGKLQGGGDAPPRTECAKLWRQRMLAHMPDLRLTLLVGTYAQDHALGRGTMTERVAKFEDFNPHIFPLPHPSWRSQHWETKNPWFNADVIPALRGAVRAALA
jgi:uracil-DNA glycosylase